MKLRYYAAIQIFESFAKGLTVPVLVLSLLQRGLTLGNVSLCLGVYALTILVLELPSGICADLLGRKKVFCLSLVLSMLAYGLVLAVPGFPVLFPAFFLYGAARAFSSGSFEALCIDHYMETHGHEKLARINTFLSVLSTASLSAGSLLGGFLPQLAPSIPTAMGPYGANFLLCIGMLIIALVLSLLLLQERLPHGAAALAAGRPTLSRYWREFLTLLKSSHILQTVLVCLLSTGLFLFGMETYWQPRFQAVLSDERLFFLIGLLAGLYFGGAVLGNLAAKALMERWKTRPDTNFYLWGRAGMALALAALALAQHYLVFMILYMLVYFFLGFSNIAEGVMIHRSVSPDKRASLLSLNSMGIQVGGLLSSLAGKLLIDRLGIPLFWGLTALVLLVFTAGAAVRLRAGKTSGVPLAVPAESAAAAGD